MSLSLSTPSQSPINRIKFVLKFNWEEGRKNACRSEDNYKPNLLLCLVLTAKLVMRITSQLISFLLVH